MDLTDLKAKEVNTRADLPPDIALATFRKVLPILGVSAQNPWDKTYSPEEVKAKEINCDNLEQ